MMRTCSVDSCERRHYAKSYCSGHYQRYMRGREIDVPFRSSRVRDCDVSHCARPHHAAGLCQNHYGQLRRGVNPVGTQMRRYAPGEWSPWRVTRDGYVRRYRRVDGVSEYELQHRVVMEEHLGRKLFPGENVHHLDGDRQNNSIQNLELWRVTQPSGRRVIDAVDAAVALLGEYGIELYGKQFEKVLALEASLRKEPHADAT